MTDSFTPDTDAQLARVDRSVERGTIIPGTDGSPDQVPLVVRLSQSYPTDVDDLWNACTSAERLPRWFAPVSGDLVLGGRYQVEGNAGGTIESCDPPHSYTVTWEFGDAVSRVTVRVEAEGDDRARLTLEQTGDIPTPWWDQFGPGATGVGWDLGFLGLASHIAVRNVIPPETTEWGQGAQAKAFMTAVSEAWIAASVAAGTPEAEARESGARTTAFYLGETPPTEH
ncbi:SRPBCC family protein [Herbiconiux sp. P17]|uniref:SRPBCC family protein n=1 Tax=Herbiconiux wuyangfengii TaxID=3342794 RepID=UPI0035B7A98E